jgi:hypothetical protein
VILIRKNILIVFVIAIVFLLTLNFTFAADENITQALSDIDEDAVGLEDCSQDSLNTNQEDIVSAEVDNLNGIDNVHTIEMGEVTKRYNGVIQYKATFYDNMGNPLKNTKVIFEVDDNNDYQPTTDSNGVALLTIAITNGNHKIAALNPQTGFIDSANIKVFDVVTGAKDIVMYYDGGDTCKVRVFDDNGKPVKAGEKVTFAIGKKTYTKKTDKNGFAKLKITSTPGLYQIGVKYKDFAVINTLYVKQVLKPLTTFKHKRVKSNIKYKVKFLGKNKKNKKIKVKFNKKTYKSKTNKKGIATFILKTPKKLGSYKLVTSYKKTKVSSIYSKYYGQ